MRWYTFLRPDGTRTRFDELPLDELQRLAANGVQPFDGPDNNDGTEQCRIELLIRALGLR